MHHVKLRSLIAALTAVTFLLDPLGLAFAAAKPKKRAGETKAEYDARTTSWWDNRDDRTEKWLRARKGKGTLDTARSSSPTPPPAKEAWHWNSPHPPTREDVREILAKQAKKNGRASISEAEERALRAGMTRMYESMRKSSPPDNYVKWLKELREVMAGDPSSGY